MKVDKFCEEKIKALGIMSKGGVDMAVGRVLVQKRQGLDLVSPWYEAVGCVIAGLFGPFLL